MVCGQPGTQHEGRKGVAPRVLVFLLPLPFAWLSQLLTVHSLCVDPVGTRCVCSLFGLKQPLLQRSPRVTSLGFTHVSDMVGFWLMGVYATYASLPCLVTKTFTFSVLFSLNGMV